MLLRITLLATALPLVACSSGDDADPTAAARAGASGTVAAGATADSGTASPVATPDEGAANSPTPDAASPAATASPTRTPPPTGTPALTATPTPAATGTPAATATLSPTAIPSATVAPTPVVTATAEPTATAPAAPPAGALVIVQGFGYQPQTIEVDPGTTVTWTNRDEVQHDADDRDGGWDGPLLDPGESWSRRFDTSGSFLVFCSIHPFMQSLVTVR